MQDEGREIQSHRIARRIWVVLTVYMERTYLGDLVCLVVGKIWVFVGEVVLWCQVGVEKLGTKSLFVAETK